MKTMPSLGPGLTHRHTMGKTNPSLRLASPRQFLIKDTDDDRHRSPC
jgi:hypothetical protein